MLANIIEVRPTGAHLLSAISRETDRFGASTECIEGE